MGATVQGAAFDGGFSIGVSKTQVGRNLFRALVSC